MKYYTTTKLSDNIHETPEGFLLCVGVPITRTGELLYGDGETPLESDAEGQVLIYRDADAVFHVDTIASFEGKPVTINHPEEFVSPHNWSYLAKGVMQNVRRGEGDQKENLLADLLITDAMAISLVKNGLREVSCGYEAEYSQTTKGRGRQTGIIGNHIALVQKGRAGSSCAINDHEGKGFKMKTLGEKFKSIFAKAADSIDVAIKDEEASKTEVKKDDSKKVESKDDMQSMSDIMMLLKELTEKVEAMSHAQPEEKAPVPSDEAKPEEKMKDDAEEEQAPSEEASMEERLKALETAVAKLLDNEAEEDDKEESEDESKSTMTGDSAVRAEILSPGIAKTKDMKAVALKNAYKTSEGKAVIDSLTGGKAIAFDSAERVETLFVAASELLKAKRSKAMSATKTSVIFEDEDSATEMTPAKINEMNHARYGLK